MYEGAGEGLRNLKSVYEESGGRVYYLGVYHPGRAAACMKTIEEALLWPGFAGLKIHPSFTVFLPMILFMSRYGNSRRSMISRY